MMSIEEKAKAYDEVLDIAKNHYKKDGYLTPQMVNALLVTMFPELAESEDEKIRKEIIEYLTFARDKNLLRANDYEKQHIWLTHLEKQKEPHYTKRNVLFDKCVENCDPEVMKSVSDKIDEMLEKEQKPAENISQLTVKGKGVYKICPHCKERMIRDDSKVYTSMPPQYGYNCPKCGNMEFDTIMYDNPEMKEQKEFYSPLCKTINDKIREYIVNHFITDTVVKTDVRSIVKAMEEGIRLGKEEQKSSECLRAERDGWYVCIKDYYRGRKKQCSVGDLIQAKGGMHMMGEENISEWFRRAYYEEVKDSFESNTDTNPEKPTEWSDEDNALLKEIVSLLKDGTVRLQHDLNLYARFLENKFKSLRPQPHWKPSKEQVSALEFALKRYPNSSLESLYNDLKKL